MVLVKDIIHLMERLAPLHYAESWDNVGLMVGSKQREVRNIITTLDVTPEVIDYAIRQNAQMIISHHPFIFKGLTSLNLDTTQGRMIEQLIKHDIVVYSAHTNLDIADGGLNDMLAARLGLAEVQGFVPTGADAVYTLTTYVPVDAADAVRYAMASAGAGSIGNYESCSFTTSGEGRFKGNDESNPVVGQRGALEVVSEEAIHVIVDRAKLSQVVQAMKEAHPYEEVAYEVVELKEPSRKRALGRVGKLPEAMSFNEFRDYVQEALPQGNLRFGGVKKESIKTIALCSGGGASFIKQAATYDAYITGDVKYHDAQLAKELGLLIVDAGHFGTEEVVATGLRDYLQAEIECRTWDAQVVAFEDQSDFFF